MENIILDPLIPKVNEDAISNSTIVEYEIKANHSSDREEAENSNSDKEIQSPIETKEADGNAEVACNITTNENLSMNNSQMERTCSSDNDNDDNESSEKSSQKGGSDVESINVSNIKPDEFNTKSLSSESDFNSSHSRSLEDIPNKVCKPVDVTCKNADVIPIFAAGADVQDKGINIDMINVKKLQSNSSDKENEPIDANLKNVSDKIEDVHELPVSDTDSYESVLNDTETADRESISKEYSNKNVKDNFDANDKNNKASVNSPTQEDSRVVGENKATVGSNFEEHSNITRGSLMDNNAQSNEAACDVNLPLTDAALMGGQPKDVENSAKVGHKELNSMNSETDTELLSFEEENRLLIDENEKFNDSISKANVKWHEKNILKVPEENLICDKSLPESNKGIRKYSENSDKGNKSAPINNENIAKVSQSALLDNKQLGETCDVLERNHDDVDVSALMKLAEIACQNSNSGIENKTLRKKAECQIDKDTSPFHIQTQSNMDQSLKCDAKPTSYEDPNKFAKNAIEDKLLNKDKGKENSKSNNIMKEKDFTNKQCTMLPNNDEILLEYNETVFEKDVCENNKVDISNNKTQSNMIESDNQEKEKETFPRVSEISAEIEHISLFRKNEENKTLGTHSENIINNFCTKGNELNTESRILNKKSDTVDDVSNVEKHTKNQRQPKQVLDKTNSGANQNLHQTKDIRTKKDSQSSEDAKTVSSDSKSNYSKTAQSSVVSVNQENKSLTKMTPKVECVDLIESDDEVKQKIDGYVCHKCLKIWNNEVLGMLFEGNESVTVNSRITYGAIICMNNYVNENMEVELRESAIRGLLDRADLGSKLESIKISTLNCWLLKLINKKKITCCEPFKPVYRSVNAATAKNI